MERAGKPRHLACGGIAMERALGGGFVQHARRFAQLLRSFGVAARYRLHGLLNGAVNAAFYRAIVLAPFEVLTVALLG